MSKGGFISRLAAVSKRREDKKKHFTILRHGAGVVAVQSSNW